jgi:hypothetical protein
MKLYSVYVHKSCDICNINFICLSNSEQLYNDYICEKCYASGCANCKERNVVGGNAVYNIICTKCNKPFCDRCITKKSGVYVCSDCATPAIRRKCNYCFVKKSCSIRHCKECGLMIYICEKCSDDFSSSAEVLCVTCYI